MSFWCYENEAVTLKNLPQDYIQDIKKPQVCSLRRLANLNPVCCESGWGQKRKTGQQIVPESREYRVVSCQHYCSIDSVVSTRRRSQELFLRFRHYTEWGGGTQQSQICSLDSVVSLLRRRSPKPSLFLRSYIQWRRSLKPRKNHGCYKQTRCQEWI